MRSRSGIGWTAWREKTRAHCGPPEAVSGTLVFGGGAHHHCVIPWSKVWAVRLAASQDVTDGLVVWPECVPPDAEPDLIAALKRMGLFHGAKPL